MFEFLNKLILFFQQYDIPYMLSGSVAMSVYVLPRATRDINIVVHLEEKNIPALLANFAQGFYCEEDAVRDAVRRKSIFNIIDHASGFKADFVILKNEEYRQAEFNRRQQTDFFGVPVYIVSAEDLLLSKLIWIQDLQSSIQMSDIGSLKKVAGLDLVYVNSWIKKLQLNTFDLL